MVRPAKYIFILFTLCLSLIFMLVYTIYHDRQSERILQHENKRLSDTAGYLHAVRSASSLLLSNRVDSALYYFGLADSLSSNRLGWKPKASAFLDRELVILDSISRILNVLEQYAGSNQNFKELMRKMGNDILTREQTADSLNRRLREMATELFRSEEQKRELEHLLEKSKHSHGILRFSIGGVKIHYYGQIQEGKANGYGIGIYNGRSTYEGSWKNNLRHGNGKYTWANGDVYEGSFVVDKREGHGSYTFGGGERYEGGWKNDKRDGKGVFYTAEGKIFLQGTWKDDKFVSRDK